MLGRDKLNEMSSSCGSVSSLSFIGTEVESLKVCIFGASGVGKSGKDELLRI